MTNHSQAPGGEGLPELPKPEFAMVYFSYEGWNDWYGYASGLAELEKDGHGTRVAYSADQMHAYALTHAATLRAEVERKSDAIQRLWKERDELRDEVERLTRELAEAQLRP